MRLSLAGGLVLVLGLALALALDRIGPDTSGVVGYVQEGGEVHAVRPEDSRSYRRGLEYFGGKSNLLADDIRRYFAELGWGRPLALLTAACSLAGSFALFRAADRPARPRDQEGPPRF